jgi:hypothetical protein
MKNTPRRTSLAAAPLLAGAPAAQSTQASLPDSSLLPLEQLRQQYRFDLFEDFLPFMDKYVIDRQHGGFMCTTDHDGAKTVRRVCGVREPRSDISRQGAAAAPAGGKR